MHIDGEYLGPDRVGYGYAATVHRCQGATFDTAHVLADGGGRELAYVAMSRARGPSHVHVVGVDPRQAVQRLAWDRDTQRRQAWTRQPGLDQQALIDLHAQRRERARAIPAEQAHQLQKARASHAEAAQQLEDLDAGRGRWADDPAGLAARRYRAAHHDYQHASTQAERPDLGWRARRKAARELDLAEDRYQHALQDWNQHGAPLAERYQQRLHHLAGEVERLDQAQHARDQYLRDHPDVLDRLRDLDLAIERAEKLDRRLRLEKAYALSLADRPTPSLDHGLAPEPDRGLSL